jgi:RNA polymerase sigma-70 factor (ECF subfamily)
MGETDEEKTSVLQSQKGDHAAFEKLMRAHQRTIHSLTFRMTGSMADAEDLAQETFIHAFQRIAEFRGDAAFSSWLYRIAVNKCLNWRQRERRQEQREQQWAPPVESGSPPPDGREPRLQKALMKLHPKQRAAIVLTICEGRSHAEAARALGCSETTISWRVFTAKGKLRRWLKEVRDE